MALSTMNKILHNKSLREGRHTEEIKKPSEVLGFLVMCCLGLFLGFMFFIMNDPFLMGKIAKAGVGFLDYVHKSTQP